MLLVPEPPHAMRALRSWSEWQHSVNTEAIGTEEFHGVPAHAHLETCSRSLSLSLCEHLKVKEPLQVSFAVQIVGGRPARHDFTVRRQ